ncbi:MAG: TauD/TfdA family dioxygenase [Acidimicrobiia bacterium]
MAIVGLLCLQTAKSGGQSKIASSVTVYNEMMATRPDLVAVMEKPFTTDRKGEIPEGKGPHYQMPIFHRYEGLLTTTYNRDFITAAQRFDDVARLTPEQVEAMDVADELADSDGIRLDMDFRPGDIQFIHNHQILHARTPYEDYPEPDRKRHLLRLWLAPPNGRPLPPVMAERFGTIEARTARGGIRVPGQTLHAPLQPE